jgi:hypothetical protein
LGDKLLTDAQVPIASPLLRRYMWMVNRAPLLMPNHLFH